MFWFPTLGIAAVVLNVVALGDGTLVYLPRQDGQRLVAPAVVGIGGLLSLPIELKAMDAVEGRLGPATATLEADQQDFVRDPPKGVAKRAGG